MGTISGEEAERRRHGGGKRDRKREKTGRGGRDALRRKQTKCGGETEDRESGRKKRK